MTLDLTLRSEKSSPLTFAEMDSNLQKIQDEVNKCATFNSVADASSALGLVVGKYVEVLDYYGGANRNNSGKMLFEVVANGTGTVDGGSIIQGVVTSGVMTVAISDNGNVYRKSSGSGNTGWVAM